VKGLFITLEGIDGSGKSTLCEGLYKSLDKAGISCLKTRAPGGSEVGKAIRELILHGHLTDIKTELFLFLADRAEHVHQVILPALNQGKVVLCDRFIDSTIAYQSQRGLERKRVAELCHYASGGLEPDLTLLIDIDPEVAYARIEKARHKDRIENEGLYLLSKIAEAYLELAREKKRILILEGAVSMSELLKVAEDHVYELIQSSRP